MTLREKEKIAGIIQNITKSDLQLLVDVMRDWSETTLQIIELNELNDAIKNYRCKDRLTLIINMENQWNTVIMDKTHATYLAHTKDTKLNLLNQLRGNSLKRIKTIRMKTNNGISALIIAKVINDFLKNSQTIPVNIKVTDIKKFDIPDLREHLERSLTTFRRTENLLTNLTKVPCVGTNAAKPAKKKGPSEPDSPAQSPAKVPKPASGGSRPRFNETDEYSKVVIQNTGPMTEEQINTFRKCINASIGLIENTGLVPKLKDLSCLPGGCLILTCEDAVSLQWLMQEIPKINQNGMKLSVLPVIICNTNIPLSEVNTVEEAFNLIKKQNDGLKTELWRILVRTRDQNSFCVSVGIDQASIDILRNLEWSAKLGMTHIEFIPVSNCSSDAMTITADSVTTPVQTETRTHDESVTACSTLTTHATTADGISGPQGGSAPHVETSPPSTSLDISEPDGMPTTQQADLNESIIRPTIDAAASTIEQALYSQTVLQTPQNKTVSPWATPKQKATTPNTTNVQQINLGTLSVANKNFTPLGSAKQKTVVKFTLPKLPEISITVLKTEGTSQTSKIDTSAAATRREPTARSQTQSFTPLPDANSSKGLTPTRPQQVLPKTHASRYSTPINKNACSGGRKARGGQTHCNPFNSFETSRSELHDIRSPTGACTTPAAVVLMPKQTVRSRAVSQTPLKQSGTPANSYSIPSNMRGLGKGNCSLGFEPSHRARTSSDIRGYQKRHTFQDDTSPLIDLTQEDKETTYEGQEYLNPCSLKGISKLQTNHYRSSQTASATAGAVVTPKQRVSSQMILPKQQIPHAAAETLLQKYPETPARSCSIISNGNANRGSQIGRVGQVYLNPRSLLETLRTSPINYTTSQSYLTASAAVGELPRQAARYRPYRVRSQKESGSSRPKLLQQGPSTSGIRGPQGRPNSQP